MIWWSKGFCSHLAELSVWSQRQSIMGTFLASFFFTTHFLRGVCYGFILWSKERNGQVLVAIVALQSIFFPHPNQAFCSIIKWRLIHVFNLLVAGTNSITHFVNRGFHNDCHWYRPDQWVNNFHLSIMGSTKCLKYQSIARPASSK